ncbi:MAG: hypothetical protein V7750_06150 [Sneathiella sp.]
MIHTSILGSVLLIASVQLSFAGDPQIPQNAKPLMETEIKELLDGNKFEFTAYDEPLTGTTSWEAGKGVVSGNYVWDKTQKGTYSVSWFLKDNKSCTKQADKDAVCQLIYLYANGFMEVNADGKIHAVSTPVN